MELIVVSCDAEARAVESLEGVQVRLVSGEEETAVEVIGPALRSNLKLGAAEAPTLGVIAVGNDLYIINGIFRWGNDRSSAPDSARDADAVN